MNQQVERPAATERGPGPDALQKIAQDFQKNRGTYIGAGILTIVVVIAVLVINNMGRGPGEDHFTPVWRAYSAASDRIVQNRSSSDELADLDKTVEAARGTSAEGAALWLSAIAHYGAAFTKDKLSFEDRRPDLEKAQARLEELQRKEFDYFPPALTRWFTTTGKPPVKQLAEQLAGDMAWAKENTYTEPQPDAAPIAVLRTDEGDIHLRFFGKLAPRHVENFVALAKAGAYNGTAFHFVRGGETKIGVAGGDPLTYFYNDALKKDHILRWGEGSTGYNIPPEPSRFRLVHTRGTVTAQRRENADWDNGAQFQILLDTDPTLDRTYSPFARVVEGIAVADAAAGRPTAATHTTFKDDPAFQSMGSQGLVVNPVWIQKVIVYDEAGNALEHSFPLEEGEKKLSSLKDTPLKPLKGAELRANRKLVDPREAESYQRYVEFPFPADIADPSQEDAAGERRVAEKATAEGQAPEEKPDEGSEEEKDAEGAPDEAEEPEQPEEKKDDGSEGGN